MTMMDSEQTPLTEDPSPGLLAQIRDAWHRLQTSTRLVVLVAFVSYTLENLLTTTPSTLYPAIVKSVEFSLDPNCSSRSAEKLIKGGDDKCKFEYLNLTFYMGLLVAAKPAAEIILSIVVGNVIDLCGHKGPMLIGCVFNAIGCIGFAFAGSFWLLFATRILQGLGSALSLMCASVLLAATFTDHDELSRSVGIATVGLGLGAVLGWPFGAFSYELMGRPGPFLILAVLCIFDGILRVISSPKVNTKDEERSPDDVRKCCGWCSWKIISDPHVLIALFNIFYYSFFISLFATFQPPMVFDRLDGEIWEIGTIVLIALIFQVLLQILTGFVALKIGLWKLTFIGFICCGVSYVIFTFLTYIWQVLGTELLNRVGHALILSSCFVQYKIATEKRHNMSYGGQMALLSMSYNLGIMLGPLVGGAVLRATDYNWLFRGLGISIVVLALPTLIFRRKSDGNSMSPVSSITELGDGVRTSSTRDDFSDLGSREDMSKPNYNESTPINHY